MKKLTIIIGSKGSGKTRKAKELVKNADKTFWPNELFSVRNPFFFSGCTPETELVVFDEVRTMDDIIPLVFWASQGIVVHKKMKASFTINPEIIIVCSHLITRHMLKPLDCHIGENIELIALTSTKSTGKLFDDSIRMMNNVLNKFPDKSFFSINLYDDSAHLIGDWSESSVEIAETLGCTIASIVPGDSSRVTYKRPSLRICFTNTPTDIFWKAYYSQQ